MEKSKFFLIMFLAIAVVVAGLIYYSYSRKSGIFINGGEKSQKREEKQQDASFHGPTGAPYIKGPEGPPPSGE